MENPLPSIEAHDWDRLIEGAGPASLLLAIDRRLGPALRAHLTAEDIFQESLLRAWRSRHAIEWQGKRAFRSWLLTLADRCIRDAADHFNAVKRGGRVSTRPFGDARAAPHASNTELAVFAGPVLTTTPSRIAIAREQAETMRQALASLPADLAELVRLRVIEQLPIADVAAVLGIGESAARHRLRKAAQLYERALTASRIERAQSRESRITPTPPTQNPAPSDGETPETAHGG